MARNKYSYNIGGDIYNKTQLINECRRILNTYRNNYIPLGSHDYFFMVDFFEQLAPEDKGDFVGKIESIRVAKAPHQTTFCFYVKRKGVKETDVSYLYPLNNPSKKTQVLTACREAIKFVVLDFRRKQTYPCKSAFSGKLIFREDEAHVDHYDDTFCKVASDWIDLNGGADVLFEDINDTEDNSSITEFKSKELRESFVAYHNSHTHLRIVMKSENLSDLRRA